MSSLADKKVRFAAVQAAELAWNESNDLETGKTSANVVCFPEVFIPG
jgi:hypothetical protein